MLTTAPRGGPAADVWAIRLGRELGIDSTAKDVVRSARGRFGGIESFHLKKKKSSLLYFHTALFTKNKKNKTWQEKKGATSGSEIIMATSWLDGWCITADRDRQHLWHGRKRTGSVWIPLTSQGCYQYSQHKPCRSPLQPPCHTYTHTQTHISNTADVDEISQRWVTTSSWAETSNATTVKI